MNTDLKKMSFPRALVAGLFCGFFTAIAVIIYAVIFREDTGFSKISGFGPLTMSVAAPLSVVIISCIYFLFVHYLTKGEMIYKVVFFLLMTGAMLLVINLQTTNEKMILTPAHGFLFGIIAIIGLADIFFLPYLVHHPGIYMTKDELKF